jgi:ATP synthase protein I
MPFHNPIPEPKPRGKTSGIVDSVVQAEKMIQVALVLPCAAFLGWLAGAWLDSLLHQRWISMAGIVIGIIAGLVGAIRLAMATSGGADADSQAGNANQKDNGKLP